MHVPRMRSSAVIHFMLTVTDEQYNAWWPGTHFRMHSLNDKTGLGQLICMDELVGDRHLQMKCIAEHFSFEFTQLPELIETLTNRETGQSAA